MLKGYFPLGMLKDVLFVRPLSYIKIVLDPVDFKMWMFYTAVLFAVALRYVTFKSFLPSVITRDNYIFIGFILVFGALFSVLVRYRSVDAIKANFGDHFHFMIGITLKVFLVLYVLLWLYLGQIILNGVVLLNIKAPTIIGLVELAAVSAAIYTFRWFNAERRFVTGAWSFRKI